MNMTFHQHLANADRALSFAVSELRAVNDNCSPVASAVLLPLLERCARLSIGVEAARAAFEAEVIRAPVATTNNAENKEADTSRECHARPTVDPRYAAVQESYGFVTHGG